MSEFDRMKAQKDELVGKEKAKERKLRSLLWQALDYEGSKLYATHRTIEPVELVSPKWYVDAYRYREVESARTKSRPLTAKRKVGERKAFSNRSKRGWVTRRLKLKEESQDG